MFAEQCLKLDDMSKDSVQVPTINAIQPICPEETHESTDLVRIIQNSSESSK